MLGNSQDFEMRLSVFMDGSLEGIHAVFRKQYTVFLFEFSRHIENRLMAGYETSRSGTKKLVRDDDLKS